MTFSSSTLREWFWEIGNFMTRRTAQRRLNGTIAIQGRRLDVRMPVGECRIVGTDGPDATLELKINAFTQEQADGVSFATQQRDGVTTLLVDGPFSGKRNLATVSATVRVPRSVELEVHSSMGAVRASDVGPIVVRANMGGIDVTGALANCDVHTSMGSVTVRLSPAWRGSAIKVGTSMGTATLAVPSGVQLDCRASSDMGRVEMQVGSTPGAPPAKVQSGMGGAKVIPA